MESSLRRFEAVRLVRSVAERLRVARAASAERDSATTFDRVAIGSDHGDVPLDEQRSVRTQGDGDGAGSLGCGHCITVDRSNF